jgi:hypothetical protein
MDLPQQSGKPEAEPVQTNSTDLIEASLETNGTTRAFRQLQNGTKESEVKERSTKWTA